jgi:hypothetical protein
MYNHVEGNLSLSMVDKSMMVNVAEESHYGVGIL